MTSPSSRRMIYNNQSRASQFSRWYDEVKHELLKTEPQNIMARALCCQNIVNECVAHMNSALGLSDMSHIARYSCQVNPLEHLKFLLLWPGLRVDNSPKAPLSKKEYEKKSKNWLNGRRAPNYGKTLFPFFITDTEKYLRGISAIATGTQDGSRQNLYFNTLMYRTLAELCRCSVSLHEQAKKAPFFCKNSIERKGRLKEILQSYASDHQYVQGFPSCFEEAIGFFSNKASACVTQFKQPFELAANVVSDKSSQPPVTGLGAALPPTTPVTFKFSDLKQPSQFNVPTTQRSGPHTDDNCMTPNSAEFWHNRFLALRKELQQERTHRLKIEKERDQLSQLMTHTQCSPSLEQQQQQQLHLQPRQQQQQQQEQQAQSQPMIATLNQRTLPLQPFSSYDSLGASASSSSSSLFSYQPQAALTHYNAQAMHQGLLPSVAQAQAHHTLRLPLPLPPQPPMHRHQQPPQIMQTQHYPQQQQQQQQQHVVKTTSQCGHGHGQTVCACSSCHSSTSEPGYPPPVDEASVMQPRSCTYNAALPAPCSVPIFSASESNGFQSVMQGGDTFSACASSAFQHQRAAYM